MKIENINHLAAYELIKHESLPDIHADGYLLRHKKSGARVALIPCSDTNKVFNIAFRTPPKNSKGMPHIIEHTVLCGSKHFPLKDPFVELVKGSLNTFLNAITYPDKTMYPVASTNDADFKNLMHVYLDAVFYPNIYREQNIFRQEGWHYELENKDDPLKINGVVYNEMKGAYSSADQVLERWTMNALYPHTTYGVDSGGDPEVIPTLTYEEYLDFHRTYYHPSNSYIYLYGDMDMAETLDFIDREYLSSFDKKDVDSGIAVEPKFASPVKVVKNYPITDEEPLENNAYLSWNVSAGSPLDLKKCLAFNVLDYALISMPGAPVKKALLENGIGKDIYGGYDDSIKQPYFSITAKDADEKDAGRFVQVIRDTLVAQAAQGIDRKSIDAALNYLEFQFREADYASYPKGLIYSIDVLGSWLYDENQPFLSLAQLPVYNELRKAADEGYFEKLINEELLDNPHMAEVVLVPERGLAAKKEKEAAASLAKYKASLTDNEINKIIDDTRKLRAWQEAPETPEALRTLPTLARSDIRREVEPLSNIELKLDGKGTDAAGDKNLKGIPAVWHETDTNGIAYIDLLWDARYVPEELVPYIGLLKSVLENIDTEGYDYAALNNEINAVTGGISCGITVNDDPADRNGYLAYFSVRCKALYENVRKGMELIREITARTKFDDKKRIGEIISQGRSQLEMVMMQAGNAAAASRASSYFSAGGAFGERTSNIGYLQFLKELEADYENKAGEIEEKLRETAGIIFRPEHLMVSYTADAAGLDAIRNSYGLVAAPTEYPSGKMLGQPLVVRPLGKRNEGFETPGQVQYVAMTGDFGAAGIPYTGAMQIFRQIMSYDYLWQNIRVKGGAYGCSASLRRDGLGTFTSYRDPHLKRTRNVYRSVPEFLRNFTADEAKMTKYIIGTMSGIDTPLTPSMFGMASMRAYLSGISDADRQKSRNEILDAEEEDIRALAPAVEAVLKENYLCAIGGTEAVERDSDLFLHIENLLG